MQCGAKTRAGHPCKTPAMPNGRCRMHGGSTPRGKDLPHTKSGRWSKDLPTRLGARYEAALQDAKLLELRDELAIIDTRLSDLFTNLDTGEAGALWAGLQKAAAEYKAERSTPKGPGLLMALLAMIEQGAAAWMQWEDVFKTIERRARIAESERRRLVEAQQMMSNEQAMTLLSVVVDTIRRHVSDPGALRGISADLGRLLSHETSAPN